MVVPLGSGTMADRLSVQHRLLLNVQIPSTRSEQGASIEATGAADCSDVGSSEEIAVGGSANVAGLRAGPLSTTTGACDGTNGAGC
jgi:hypothetical protein